MKLFSLGVCVYMYVCNHLMGSTSASFSLNVQVMLHQRQFLVLLQLLQSLMMLQFLLLQFLMMLGYVIPVSITSVDVSVASFFCCCCCSVVVVVSLLLILLILLTKSYCIICFCSNKRYSLLQILLLPVADAWITDASC